MSVRALKLAFCLSIFLTNHLLVAGAKLSLGLNQHQGIIISVDSTLHEEFGLSFPVTYRFAIPSGSSALTVLKRYSLSDRWEALQEKQPGDFFNGIEAVRFDYAAAMAYISVSFDPTSNQIYLKIVDASGQPVPGQYQGICRYYDNRRAVVVFSADDWSDTTNKQFLSVVHILRSYRLPVTVAIITAICSDSIAWPAIQSELDSGGVEAASHTRHHLNPPYPDPTAEIMGSKADIIEHLQLPVSFRKGSQSYVYTWIAPYGSTNGQIETLVGKARYLSERLTYPTNGSFAPWDSLQQRYKPDGKLLEMGLLYGGITDVNLLRRRFDTAYANGAIYHVMLHPYQLSETGEWSKPYFQAHLAYISNRTDVWYTTFGMLYLYHLLQDDRTGPIHVQASIPVVVREPLHQVVAPSGRATFSIEAVCSAPFHYRWQKNGMSLPGTDSSSYTTPIVTRKDRSAQYRCIVYNSEGSDTSDAVVLTVALLPVTHTWMGAQPKTDPGQDIRTEPSLGEQDNVAGPAASARTRESAIPSPNEFFLQGNYPNPFNPSTIIRYGLAGPARVSMTVYTLLGEQVAKLVDEEQPGGMYEVVWNGRGGRGELLSSGIYLCRMVATAASVRTHVATIRMLLMK